MDKKYLKLREALLSSKLRAPELALMLNCSTMHISRLLNAQTEWRLSDIYTVMKALNIPLWATPEYFPPNGELVAECIPPISEVEVRTERYIASGSLL